MADIRYNSNAIQFPGQACVGGSRVGPVRVAGREAGLRADGTMTASHSYNGPNVAGNLRTNTGPNVAGSVKIPPQS